VDCPVITRTHGPDPVEWFVAGEQGEVPVPATKAKDTSGAGDVWHGALTLGVARLGRVPEAADMPELIAFANHIAGIRVRHEGASWRARLR
jgi:sulfofructose kinase